MIINKSIDIEDEIRQALTGYVTAYARPLPANYALPNILVTQVGGRTAQTIDTFTVSLQSRARSSADALSYLNTTIGVLKQIAREQTCAIRHVVAENPGSWGTDPVRPDLAMCSALLSVVAHQTTTEV